MYRLRGRRDVNVEYRPIVCFVYVVYIQGERDSSLSLLGDNKLP